MHKSWGKCSSDYYTGEACHITGCPLHEWKINTRPYPRSPCGEYPPNTNEHCSRGVCVVPTGQVFGLNRGSPAPDASSLNQGVCVCRTAPDRGKYIENLGQNNFTETVCMTDDTKLYIGGSCGAECLCDDQLKGVCMAGASRNGCTCRQNPQKHKLFTGLSCEQPCEGLCEMNGNVCEPLAATSRAGAKFGSSLIANKCPCHNTNCSKTPSSPDCFANLYPCSRAGFFQAAATLRANATVYGKSWRLP